MEQTGRELRLIFVCLRPFFCSIEKVLFQDKVWGRVLVFYINQSKATRYEHFHDFNGQPPVARGMSCRRAGVEFIAHASGVRADLGQ
jgi:hypothetical protein